MTNQPYKNSFPRRNFIKGAAALGAGAALARPGQAAAAVSAGVGGMPVLRGSTFDLRTDRIRVNKSGTETWANAINGIVPGPVLNWREGDVVTINVTNNLPEMTAVSCSNCHHGLVPRDGVVRLPF